MPQPSLKETTEPEAWPPDYVAVFAWRQQQIRRMRSDPSLVVGAREYYRTRPVEFINHWCDTYDPRNAGGTLPARMPFRLFRRQRDMVLFLLDCLNGDASGLIEKAAASAAWAAEAAEAALEAAEEAADRICDAVLDAIEAQIEAST